MDSILKQFEHNAELFPGKPAIEFIDQIITYHELNQAAEHAAEKLATNNIDSNMIVAVYLESSINCVISILAIMKINAIYMPLNTDFPSKRLSSVLNKVKPHAFITDQLKQGEILTKLQQSEIDCLTSRFFVFNVEMTLDSKSYTFKTPSPPNLSNTYPGDNEKTDKSSYIITTSGSTGEPKVILGSRKGLDHFLNWEKNEFGFNEQIRCSQLSPISFDVSLRDIFIPLISGGTLCIPGEVIRHNPEKLLKWMVQKKLSLIHIVPTLFRMITHEMVKSNHAQKRLPDLKYALIAGEMLFGSDIDNWYKTAGDHVELVNLYGPSETTLAKLFFRIKKNTFSPLESIPVGRPIPDTEVMVINGKSLCDVNQPGEIYIKTTFMSNGYYNAPELNEKAFIPDPLSAEEKSLVYKTGDTGFLMPDYNIRLTGRIDGQIKLNGKRIETGEIEIALMRHPSIESAAVKAFTDTSGHKRLIGYIVTKNLISITVEALRVFLTQLLPTHMIPNTFVYLKSMPLNHSGKIDRNALPEPSQNRPEMDQGYEPPASPLEKKMATIWSQYLCIDRIGVLDNFFDLGGTSVLSTEVIGKINQEFQVSLDVVKLFHYPTIRMLSNHLSGDGVSDFSSSVNRLQNRGRLRQQSIRRRVHPGGRM